MAVKGLLAPTVTRDLAREGDQRAALVGVWVGAWSAHTGHTPGWLVVAVAWALVLKSRAPVGRSRRWSLACSERWLALEAS
jgi:hypothetical protein